MLIMNSRKMIYVHIQKCGGTSIERSFYEKSRWNDVFIGSTEMGEMIQSRYLTKYGLHKHSSAIDIKGVIEKEPWEAYFKWATVRNPYSRAVSLYNFSAFIVDLYGKAVNFPFDASGDAQSAWAEAPGRLKAEPWNYPVVQAFLRSRRAERPFSAFLRDPDTAQDGGFQPQWQSVRDVNGENCALDKIIKLEDLEAEWPRLCAMIGAPDAPLLRENVSAPRVLLRTSELFDQPEDIAYIRERFADDFARFGYDPAVIP